MAENPRDWNPTERLIADTIIKHDESMRQGVVGFSIVTKLYLALKEAGMLKEEGDAET